MDIPTELNGLVSDYVCRVIDIHLLKDAVIEQFQSDFKHIAYFFKYGEDYVKKIGETGGLVHPQEVADLIAIFNGTNMDSIKLNIARMLKEGKVVSMCNIVQDIETKVEIKTYLKIVDDELITIEQAAEKMGLSVDEFKQKAKEFGLL